MKKIISTLLLLAAIIVPAAAKDTYVHDASVLPAAARTTLNYHFKDTGVSVVKIEKDFGRVSEYEVTMTDGCEISFDADGNWENVEANVAKEVPASFIPKAIAKHLAATEPGARVIGIEHDRKGFEIELSNGKELKYDVQGKFLRYDH